MKEDGTIKREKEWRKNRIKKKEKWDGPMNIVNQSVSSICPWKHNHNQVISSFFSFSLFPQSFGHFLRHCQTLYPNIKTRTLAVLVIQWNLHAIIAHIFLEHNNHYSF
ncbi:hypothetical protein HPP92_016560 [Vanilla planifolia]|uniref:Uncharacterized protein n=1 Tax=Vanilla planifolia TaxID=51239 RepID=A0A835QFX1_VANPL|nr:hypothetical protein HPP92_016560 [Vanilla planifolia]